MNDFFLKLNPSKTKILVVAPPSLLEKISIHGVFLDNKCIRFVSSARNLGIMLDEELTFREHIKNTIRNCFTIKKLSQIKGFLSEDQLAQMISSEVFSRLDYCNALFYGITNDLIDRMQSVQNCAARLISKVRLTTLDNFFVERHNWLKVKFRRLYKILLIVHKCLHGNAPEELRKLIVQGQSSRTMHLRGTAYKSKYGKRAFAHSGPRLWNLLPLGLRIEVNTEKFKKMLKSYLMLSGDSFILAIDRT